MSQAPRKTPIADVIDRVTTSVEPGSTMVLAVSALTFGDDGSIRRIGVFSLEGDALTPIADARVDNGDGGPLYTALAALGTVEIGGWDAHFADSWTWVWSRNADRFAWWHRDQGLQGTASKAGLVDGERTHPWTDLDQVEVWASADLVHRTLQTPRTDAEPVVLIAVEDGTAMVDPTYDKVMLQAETEWMVEAAQALAAAMAKPFFDQR